MGYDLIAKKKNIESVTFGAFSWPVMIEKTGMCYILNCGAGRRPASYVYNSGNNGSPYSNDGYAVNAFEAKAMARIARGYVFVQTHVNKEWEGLSEEDKTNAINYNKKENIYRESIGDDFLNRLIKFADFAEKSGGFKII